MKTLIHNIIPLCMAAFAASAAPSQTAEVKGPRFVVANGESIAIPLEGSGTPFPSDIQVSHVPGVISKLTVTLSDLNDSFPEDLQIWLRAPSGQMIGLLINEGGVDRVTNATLTFDDEAASVIPDPLISGRFKPTVNGEYVTDPNLFRPLSTFNGEDPNGTWSLFLVNRVLGGEPTGGCICDGWSLEIQTDPSKGHRHED
jgi:hypothetical protein